MEILCEMTVEIGGYKKSAEKEIIRMCMVEWSFREEDFYHRPSDDGRHELLEASALGTLYADYEEKDVTKRIEHAVWRVNGSMCHVQVHAVRLNRHSLRPRNDEEELQIA